MNYMKEIAHMLGLEIGEEFKIEGPNNYKYKFEDNLMTLMPDGRWCTAPAMLNQILEGKYKIIKPILTKEEREYLSMVIKPFRDDIRCIHKYTCFNDTKEYLFGRAKDYSHLELPAFERGTMYRGMELCKEYTLEELGL